MSAPRLQDVLAEHAVGQYSWGPEDCTYPCEWTGPLDEHPAHQAVVWREVCMVRTVEQLDALPPMAVIREDTGDITEKQAVDGPACWRVLGADIDKYGDLELIVNPALPALLVWHPTWEAS